jgi:hypothetical protein
LLSIHSRRSTRSHWIEHGSRPRHCGCNLIERLPHRRQCHRLGYPDAGRRKSEGPGRFLEEPRAFYMPARAQSARRLHCLYARNARRCPVPRGTCIGVPEASHRLYNCARCARQVQICRRCDRGNLYCAGTCAAVRRRESLLRAGRRYQLSLRGACRHAARQCAWRARQAHKVTHQGSPVARFSATVTAPSIASRGEVSHGDTTQVESRLLLRAVPRCSFCAHALSPFARWGPLRGGP